MKKSLLAVAVLGAMSGAAFAQVAPNNITLYGIVDAGLQNQRVTGTNVDSASVSGLNSGIQSGNRWGLRGSEDLGGGLRANFNLESGFTLDNGTSAQGSRLFGRASWVGLSGGFGEVRLGRQTIFSSAFVVGIADPFGVGFGLAGYQGTVPNLGIAASSAPGGGVPGIVGTGNFNLGSQAAGTQRNDNTLMYLSPNINGFQGGVYYTFGEVATPRTPSTAKANWVGAGVTYTQGPLALGLAYDTRDSSTNATNSRDDKWLNLAASYNFGVATVRFGYYDEDASLSNNGQADADRSGWILGATVPLGGGSLLASYQTGKIDYRPATAADDKLRKYAFGYTYPLSRRTNVYTSFAQARLKDEGSSPSTIKAREFSLGVRHTF
ncbi:MAG: porin [Burkholderiales bacterium]|jgi:GBP family porin|nr:porin [Burkholderiales bacterium]MCA3162107.1 porin [Burkholderiales bacterium]MCA3165654.1 porin [Burkholderiales bacterium]MCA3169886.1 porin [Burkholderiales bacterium]MCA3172143.1 porin [Burkholderiales bacterium]